IDQVFWVTALHPERAQYVSPAFEKIWGFPPAKLYRNARAWTDCVVPIDRARVVAAFDACVRGETPHFHAEFRILRPDGSIRWVLDNGVPIRNERGQVYRISGITKDVTERKQAEAALRESEERLGLAIEGAELGMWDRDIRTGEAVYNDRWAGMLGYPLDEIEPTTEAWQELIHPDDLARVRQALDAHFAGETPFYEAEYRMRAKSGAWKWILARGRVVQRDADGTPLRITGTHLDVTARKQAEEESVELELQVQHAQKLESLGVLAGGIAHDFNNLLVAIVGNADLALDTLPPGSQARRNIAEIETAAQRAAELCRQMLAYSGKGRFVVAPMQINDIVEEITHLLAVSISKKATVRYNLAEDLPAIEVDPTQVRQVIMNLITNASEALGDEDGVIAVVTGMMECNCDYLSKTYLAEGLAEGPYVYLDVTDTGCGMDDATRESIFDPFFTTKFTGRGLGLAAVLGIVRGHKGAIRVFTEPGRGTSFRILFPAADEPAQPLAREHEPPADADKPWRGSGTVLLVDDEETIRIVGSRMLEHLGFQTLTADNGVEALDLYRQRADDIACVLLDLTMPHMDGEETFRELRALNPDVRVILSSGYDQQEVARRFAGKGMAGFLQKPFRTATLADKLREVIDAPSA
ncbi:PAS domain-containing protein, partial [bacterium]|nr:PAS domain-containing protein [bacterium]